MRSAKSKTTVPKEKENMSNKSPEQSTKNRKNSKKSQKKTKNVAKLKKKKKKKIYKFVVSLNFGKWVRTKDISAYSRING